MELLCYIHMCNKQTDSFEEMLEHFLKNHTGRILMRKFVLNEEDGCAGYKSIHFNVTTQYILSRKDTSKAYVDEESMTIRFKRINKESPQIQELPIADMPEQPDKHQFDESILKVILEKMDHIGRDNDFKNLLNSIANGKLPLSNIALHLLLDIGQILSQRKVNSMRYSDLTLDFWLVVSRLFKAKGLRFFRGFMADGHKESVKEGKCIWFKHI